MKHTKRPLIGRGEDTQFNGLSPAIGETKPIFLDRPLLFASKSRFLFVCPLFYFINEVKDGWLSDEGRKLSEYLNVPFEEN